MSLLRLQRKVARLEGGGGAPPSPLGPGWWDEFEGYALVTDRSWRPHCTLDQFVVGRAALLANLWAGRLVCGLGHWQWYREPDWWTSKVWRAKTPDWEERIAREQRLHCPKENRKSMALFVDWLYGDAPKREYERPWKWCQRDVGSLYHWPSWEFQQHGLLPVAHALAIASACWLVDDLGLTPRQVQDAALEHRCAFKWRDLSSLQKVHLPPRSITGTSPKLRLAEMTEWCKAHNIPVDEQRSRQGDGLELLEFLLCVASGVGGPHGRELWFPALRGGQ